MDGRKQVSGELLEVHVRLQSRDLQPRKDHGEHDDLGMWTQALLCRPQSREFCGTVENNVPECTQGVPSLGW